MRALLKIIAIFSILSPMSQQLSAMDFSGCGCGNINFGTLGGGDFVVGRDDSHSFGWNMRLQFPTEECCENCRLHKARLAAAQKPAPKKEPEVQKPEIIPDNILDKMNELVVRFNLGGSGNLALVYSPPSLPPIRKKYDQNPLLYAICDVLTDKKYSSPVAYVILKTEDHPQWKELQDYFVRYAEIIDVCIQNGGLSAM